MSDNLETSADAQQAFHDTVVQLVTNLRPVVERNSKKGANTPAKPTAGQGTIMGILTSNAISPMVRHSMLVAWAQNMGADIFPRFTKLTKPYWKILDTGTSEQIEDAVLKIIDSMKEMIPGGDVSILRDLYEKKGVLYPPERKALEEYFKTCCYYAEIYEELLLAERKKARR